MTTKYIDFLIYPIHAYIGAIDYAYMYISIFFIYIYKECSKVVYYIESLIFQRFSAYKFPYILDVAL